MPSVPDTSGHDAVDPVAPAAGDAVYADARYLVHDPRQVRALLRALIEQRSTLSVYPDGREPFFASAVLESGDDHVLLDGNRNDSVNQRASAAAFLLCHAQVDQVKLRFRVDRPTREQGDGYVWFRAPLPVEVYHLQRRELYRVEPSLDDAPWCRIPDPEGGEALRLRAADISAGGVAVVMPVTQQLFALDQRIPGCVLELPDGSEVTLTLGVRNLVPRLRPDGSEQLRVGLRFENLARGADGIIQRNIFNIERRRNARMSGNG